MSYSMAILKIGQIPEMGVVAKISLEDQWHGTLGSNEQNPSFVFQAEFNPPSSPLQPSVPHDKGVPEVSDSREFDSSVAPTP